MWRFPEASPFATALAKGHLSSTGIGYEELERPIIGIVNSWNEIVPGHYPLRQVAEWVRDGILSQGGLPLEFNTIAICDGIAQGQAGMRYPLPSREIIADSIESMVEAHGFFDGLVFLAACDKVTPAMLMAAGRLNLPSLVVTSGPMRPFRDTQARKNARVRFLGGESAERELVEEGLDFYSGPGVCPFFGTANTMMVLAEAMGMALSGSALIPWGSAQRRISAFRAGQQVVELVRAGLRPKEILRRQAFINAAKVLGATGGSLNALIHLPAVASECGIELTWKDIDLACRDVPFLTPVIPNGPFHVVDLYFAGGVPAVMKEIAPELELDGENVNLRRWEDILQSAAVTDRQVIRPLSDPVSRDGGIAVLYGSLAPNGALVKTSAIPPGMMQFRGPAKVFDSEESCTEALEHGKVPEGSVVIIRYEGPRGGPGMKEMHLITEWIERLGRTALVTDGRFSGTSAGLSVGYVCPEAYVGGPIGLVRDGDEIVIDIRSRKLDLVVSAEELEQRRKDWIPVNKVTHSRLLETYRRSVSQACQGAVRVPAGV